MTLMPIDPVGIAGTGALAAAIAAPMAATGVRTIVHGFVPDAAVPTSPGRKSRFEPAANLFDLASECEVVITAYTTQAALREALTGTSDRPGLIGALQPGAILVDFSGGHPDDSRRLAGQLAGGAIGLIECAMLGGLDAVRSGTARVYTGGFGEHIERVRPLLSALGLVTRAGPQGHGRILAALAGTVHAALGMVIAETGAIARAYEIPGDLMQGAIALEAVPPRPAATDVDAATAPPAAHAATLAAALARAGTIETPLIDALAAISGHGLRAT